MYVSSLFEFELIFFGIGVCVFLFENERKMYRGAKNKKEFRLLIFVLLKKYESFKSDIMF